MITNMEDEVKNLTEEQEPCEPTGPAGTCEPGGPEEQEPCEPTGPDGPEEQEPCEPTGPAGTCEPCEPDGKTKLQSYKAVSAKLGLSMIVYFVCRILNGFILEWIGDSGVVVNYTAAYAISMILAVVLGYIIPILFTVIIFKSFRFYGERGGFAAMYKKPRRIARALGTFPAMYGLGVGTVLLTLLISYLISKLTGGQALIQDILRPTTVQPPSDIASTLMIVFLLVVIAPVFEEIWVRGIMYDALKPFGCGMAIMISSILFGLMHGSLDRLFYSTALGFALGYVRYATGSIFITTILHAIVNTVAAGLLFLMSMSEIANYGNRLINTMHNMYVLAVLVLLAAGLIAFIRKIPVIRKYKLDNEWGEVGPWKKTALFFASIPVILMLVLAINEHAYGWFLNLILR